jgi:hypothetical protein
MSGSVCDISDREAAGLDQLYYGNERGAIVGFSSPHTSAEAPVPQVSCPPVKFLVRVVMTRRRCSGVLALSMSNSPVREDRWRAKLFRRRRLGVKIKLTQQPRHRQPRSIPAHG